MAEMRPFISTMSDPILPFVNDGEISAESLEELNQLLDQSPGEDSSEEEVAAFMEKVMATGAGAKLIGGLAEQLTERGDLAEMLAEEPEELEEVNDYRELTSPARMIFKVELTGVDVGIWRRVSLPADCSFFDLHCAIQDSLGWLDQHRHEFQVRENGVVAVAFGVGKVEGERDDLYCGIQNEITELVTNGIHSFHYLYEAEGVWEGLIMVEDLVPAGEKGTSNGLQPCVHDGIGLCPPEDCGGPDGFRKFLAGEHPLAIEYGEELVERIRAGEFDPGAVRFRNVAEVAKLV